MGRIIYNNGQTMASFASPEESKVDNVFARGVCVRCGRSFKGEGTLGPNCKNKV